MNVGAPPTRPCWTIGRDCETLSASLSTWLRVVVETLELARRAERIVAGSASLSDSGGALERFFRLAPADKRGAPGPDWCSIWKRSNDREAPA